MNSTTNNNNNNNDNDIHSYVHEMSGMKSLGVFGMCATRAAARGARPRERTARRWFEPGGAPGRPPYLQTPSRKSHTNFILYPFVA